SYIDFEGGIPKGNYGAGTVILWDLGTYECHKWEDAEVMVTLHGKRVTGRYVLFRTRGDDWMIHRMDPPQDPTREPMPEDLLPMRAVPGDLPADDAEWAFEIRWPGTRALLFCEGGRARVVAGDGTDMSEEVPELRPLGRALGAREVVLDGVLVAYDDANRPDPERLVRRLSGARGARREIPLTHVTFDVLYLDGHSTVARPYRDR